MAREKVEFPINHELSTMSYFAMNYFQLCFEFSISNELKLGGVRNAKDKKRIRNN